jgi:hypothetical protein
MAGVINPCGCSPPIVCSVRMLKRRDSRVTRRRSNLCFQTHAATTSNDETGLVFQPVIGWHPYTFIFPYLFDVGWIADRQMRCLSARRT